MAESLLRLDRVTQTFKTKGGEVRAAEEISLELAAGRVTCLVGESGSGKTTTARIVAGMDIPSSGGVYFEGREIGGLSRRDRVAYRLGVQYVHQDPYSSLNPTRTIASTLAAPLRRNRITRGRTATEERIRELLTQVELTPAEDFLHKYPHQLSGGQRQRVSVARALSTDPRLIVADEATSMLDASIRVSMLNVLGRLRDELDVGFLFITHDLALAKYFAWDGDLAVMYLGRVVEHGPTREVLEHPAHPYTRALLTAVPEPDPRLAKAESRLELRSDDVPSILTIPPGCAFHPRCPMAEEGVCTGVRPEPTPLTPDHHAACHRLDAVDLEMPLPRSETSEISEISETSETSETSEAHP